MSTQRHAVIFGVVVSAVLSGSFLRLVGDWTLSGIPAVVEIGGDPVVNPLAARYPADSMRWVGGGAMLVAVSYSLLVMLRNRRVAAAANSVDALLELEPRLRRNLAASIATEPSSSSVGLFSPTASVRSQWR